MSQATENARAAHRRFLAGFEAEPTPDWDALAIFCDTCEELGETRFLPVCQWLVANRKWPAYFFQKMTDQIPWGWIDSPNSIRDFTTDAPAKLPDYAILDPKWINLLENRLKRLPWWPTWRDAVLGLADLVPGSSK